MLASAGIDRQSGRMPPECEALLVTGIYGSGKTSLIEEIADRYERLGVAFGAIDLDWLGWYHLPDNGGSDPEPDLQLENLREVAARYWRSGVRYLLVAGAAKDDSDVRQHSFSSSLSPTGGPPRHPDRGRRAASDAGTHQRTRSRPAGRPRLGRAGLGASVGRPDPLWRCPTSRARRGGADLARLAACHVAVLSDLPCIVWPWTR